MVTTYLISGANRGIGLGFVQLLAQRDDVVIFAGSREPAKSEALKALTDKYPNKVHIVKLISADAANNQAAIEEIKTIAGRLDVVVANAGISNWYGPGLEASEEKMLDHFKINVMGPLELLKASYPLLKVSTASPKFFIISSGAGSIEFGATLPMPMLPYGTSKAAVNYLARKLHFEYDGLVIYPLSPGPVDTDMAVLLPKEFQNLPELKWLTVEQSVSGMLAVMDKAVREEKGPRLISHDGSEIPW